MGDDAWRHRFMAPVYALVIAFVIVFVGGWVIDLTPGVADTDNTSPSQQPPTPTAVPTSDVENPDRSGSNTVSELPAPLPEQPPLTGSAANDVVTGAPNAPANAASTRLVPRKADR
jgi:hypothetical protein